MAEESDLEKTEPASQKRLDQAREEGDVPRSRELSTCTILLAAGAAFWSLGDGLVRELSRSLTAGLMFDRSSAYDFNLLIGQLGMNLFQVALAFAPVAGVLVIVALASPVLIGGWLFSAKALAPNFGRMNPISGLGNMVSSRAGVELVKAVIKTLIVGSVAWIVIMGQKQAIFGLPLESLHAGISHVGHMLLVCFMSIVGALVLIAAIDAPYQMWHYADKLKMTRQEMIEEAKEANGNPQMKAKIRQQQREMARRRMMAEIPTADVIVTNPTHYAVALKYTEGGNGAPKVVAKGADEIAAKIREIGKENNIPLLAAPPLARALYKHTELGQQIPEALYAAVAEVLAYVYQLRTYREHGGVRPQLPEKLDVPAELDPNNASGVSV
ncbi:MULTISPECIES: flagellar biosynthesis protein FlhB [unclassified Undibacterium]|uniref:flagellar biosynthesis protein FlhB n=1 Tax=unclassified Undibacterium TaxID=2630295 RepID=UPI002AC9545A|nr:MULTISPECIES: flagellar biosynthesis protein FlhB [unclassified Undibacterium]MEB0138798.1 flagellar biosynthesis protein FlhB [Undibacterium sp. CCC2.1]MEB0170726.1 flagellar biosynthesis protein FlhB [Undibacterium sp. CCC1.1]MEB0174615.1 flagellar biosynthesis protein FlhB [Undibacterium sp. CCC3.4]MEB0213812.1 flagellar biosynthesis protein FlhB [Undibacterium sp. 5I2]WPX42539.1 flagellar biosynthesis protein FlhB [Undibacterium sp. CCC3.4]